MKRSVGICLSLLVVGCAYLPPGPITEWLGMRQVLKVKSPDGMVVPLGGKLRFRSNLPVPPEGWILEPQTRHRATLDGAGTLTALQPGAIRIRVHVPGANNDSHFAVACVESPSTERPLAEFRGYAGGDDVVMILNSQAELEHIWRTTVGNRAGASPSPTVDFSQRSVLAIMRPYHLGAYWHRAVFTHLDEGPPATVHLTYPYLFDVTPVIPEPEFRLEFLEIRKVPSQALIDVFGRVFKPQDPYYTPPPPPPPTPKPSPSPPRPRFHLEPLSACVGQQMRVVGEHYPPGMRFQIYVGSERSAADPALRPPSGETRLVGETVADAEGRFQFTFELTAAHLALANQHGDAPVWLVPAEASGPLKAEFDAIGICPPGASQ